MQKQKNQKSSNRTELITTIVVWAVIILTPLTIMYWGNIKSFFATTPQAKCEALIKSSDKNSYCTQAGERRSHKADKLAQEKSECLAKSPYFQWTGETAIVEGRCERAKYESRQACIDDGKQGVRSIRLPADEGGGSEIVGTRCLDDGTWEAYDPEYEDYKQQQAIEADRTTCVDTTSHDYNWNNDMLCTRPDGSQFYTSYEGARGY